MHRFTSGLWQLTGSLAVFRGMGRAILAATSVVRAFRISVIGVVVRCFQPLQDRFSTEPIFDQLTSESLKSAVVGIDLDSGSYDPGMSKY